MKNKKKNLLGLIRCIIFTVIFALLFVEAAYILVPKVRDDSTDEFVNMVNSYKSLDENTVDLVIFGNSDAYRALNPNKIYLDLDITACVIGTPDISMGEIYYRAKDIIKYQSPKCFVLETDCMFAESNYFDEDGNYIEPEVEETVNDYGESAIQTKFSEIENDIEVAIDSKYPLIKYNYRWKQLTLTELRNTTRKTEFTSRGFLTSKTVNGFKYGDTYMGTQDGETEEYDVNALKYFNKLIELCEENDIELSLVSVPSGCSWNWHKHNTVEQLAQEK
jgi:hypothetical protein